jgi:hypothetical protein
MKKHYFCVALSAMLFALCFPVEAQQNRSKQGLTGASFREENATRVTSESSVRFVMRIEFLSSSLGCLAVGRLSASDTRLETD